MCCVFFLVTGRHHPLKRLILCSGLHGRRPFLSGTSYSFTGRSCTGLLASDAVAMCLQVWPVLSAGGASQKAMGMTPSLTLSMHLNPPISPASFSSRPTALPSGGHSHAGRPSSGRSGLGSGGSAAAAVASIQLRPSTVWLSLPFLQRLQSFFEPLSSMPVPAAQMNRCALALRVPNLHFTCVHPDITLYILSLLVNILTFTCVHPHFTCVHPHFTCVHPYFTCVHPDITVYILTSPVYILTYLCTSSPYYVHPLITVYVSSLLFTSSLVIWSPQSVISCT